MKKKKKNRERPFEFSPNEEKSILLNRYIKTIRTTEKGGKGGGGVYIFAVNQVKTIPHWHDLPDSCILKPKSKYSIKLCS